MHSASGNYFCKRKRPTSVRIHEELHYIFNVCIVDVCQKFCYNTLYHTLSYLSHGFGSRTASTPVVIFGPAPSNVDTCLGPQVTTNCVRTPTTRSSSPTYQHHESRIGSRAGTGIKSGKDLRFQISSAQAFW